MKSLLRRLPSTESDADLFPALQVRRFWSTFAFVGARGGPRCCEESQRGRWGLCSLYASCGSFFPWRPPSILSKGCDKLSCSVLLCLSLAGAVFGRWCLFEHRLLGRLQAWLRKPDRPELCAVCFDDAAHDCDGSDRGRRCPCPLTTVNPKP